MIAYERCHQLAEELYLLASKVTYDDVQEAAALILQCISNVKSVSLSLYNIINSLKVLYDNF